MGGSSISRSGRIIGIAVTVVSVVGVIAYPLLVYFGLANLEPRTLGLAIALFVIPLALLRLRAAARRQGVSSGRALLGIAGPLLPAPLLGLGTAWSGDPRLLLALPVVINLALLVGFASTLTRGRTPMIERFARLQEPELPPRGPAYCRRVTWVWVAFFGLNAAIAGGLAIAAPLDWWTIYTGLVAYALMGMLFTIEYIVRRAKFRRFGSHALDRVLRAIIVGRGEA